METPSSLNPDVRIRFHHHSILCRMQYLCVLLRRLPAEDDYDGVGEAVGGEGKLGNRGV